MKHLIYSLIICFLLSITFWGCQEDTVEPDFYGELYGEVVSADNTPIIGATISTTPPTNNILTDSAGQFQFQQVPTGSISVRAQKAGFLSQLVTISVFKDQATTVVVTMDPDSTANIGPETPILVSPAAGEKDVPVNTTFTWIGSDADDVGDLTYRVLLFPQGVSDPIILGENITDTFLVVDDLRFSESYVWQVVANDGVSDDVYSLVHSFSTESQVNYRIYFARKDDLGKYDIYGGHEDGSLAAKITSNAGNNWRPRVSYDRSKLAYLSDVGAETHIYVIDRNNNSLVHKVTTIPVSGFRDTDLNFGWSPDGTQIVYPSNNQLYRVNVDGSGTTTIAQAPSGMYFASANWSPTSNRIAVRVNGPNIYNCQVYVIDIQGNTLGVVQDDIAGVTGSGVWNIIGQKVLYTHDRSGLELPSGRQLDSHIYASAIGGFATSLSIFKPAGTNDLDPIWSPTGGKVLFVNRTNDGVEPPDLYIMDDIGDNRTLIYSNAEMPDWQ